LKLGRPASPLLVDPDDEVALGDATGHDDRGEGDVGLSFMRSARVCAPVALSV